VNTQSVNVNVFWICNALPKDLIWHSTGVYVLRDYTFFLKENSGAK